MKMCRVVDAIRTMWGGENYVGGKAGLWYFRFPLMMWSIRPKPTLECWKPLLCAKYLFSWRQEPAPSSTKGNRFERVRMKYENGSRYEASSKMGNSQGTMKIEYSSWGNSKLCILIVDSKLPPHTFPSRSQNTIDSSFRYPAMPPGGVIKHPLLSLPAKIRGFVQVVVD